MCSRHQSVRLDDDLRNFFKAMPIGGPTDLKQDVFQTYEAPFIRRPRKRDSGDEAVPEREAVIGRFGLIPHYASNSRKGAEPPIPAHGTRDRGKVLQARSNA